MPRTLICISAPLNAEGNVQMIGRIYRANTKSRSKAFYIFANNADSETWKAAIVTRKMQVLNATVGGEVDKFNLENMDLLDLEGDAGSFSNWLDGKKGQTDEVVDDDNKGRKVHQLNNLKDNPNGIVGKDLPNPMPYHAWVEPVRDRYGRRGITSYNIFFQATNPDILTKFADANKTMLDKHGFVRANARYVGAHLVSNVEDKDKMNTVWNWVCNIFMPMQVDYVGSEEQVFEVGDRVRFAMDEFVSGAKADDKGTIMVVRKRRRNKIKNDKETKDRTGEEYTNFYSYFYNVQLDDGRLAVRTPQEFLIVWHA
jgi:hypothetical protein